MTERAEVERLAAEGVSVRGIAAEVFGDARYRGRVERILHKPATSATAAPLVADPLLEGIDVTELGTVRSTRLLLERLLASWVSSGETPSATELKTLLELERRLQAFESVERLNRLHRELRSG